MNLNWIQAASCHGRRLAWGAAGAILLSCPAAYAATDVQVWHFLNPHNRDVFEKLVKDFNKSQDGVKVKLKAFDNDADLETAMAGIKTADQRPQLIQLDDERVRTEADLPKYIQPMYVMLGKHPIKNVKWFLSDTNTFVRDSKGRLLAFPYMAEVPVMYYNIESFKKAGLNPTVPDRAWSGLQAQLVTLANNGSRKCPLTSDQSVSVNLENLAAVNNQLFAGNDNGLGAKGKPGFSFDVVYIRHLSLMISWVRSEIMVKPAHNAQATKRFANNECAVLTSKSSNLGWFNDTRNLNFSVSGLPYYPEVTAKPGAPFVSGAGLWATAGQTKDSEAASARFLDYLAQADNATRWYQQTGFLPLTQQAFSDTGSGYYKNLGDWQNLVAVYSKPISGNSRGFRIDNYPRIRAMFRDTLDDALAGNKPAVTALKTAAAEATKLMQAKK
ncbi:extracellular solute-binding protein [Pusillimonas sp. ANT_WB101]|uniref:extracellular solute-binding protein n=1 Tax=Pusillimonas sp. ANT_WB101 TaxID=2597356 RepID=UPI0011ECB68F|nr:extracellular solute-binding protein [Pusillimonas sp. ANT_WB101]KAA0911771.1 extracellular solute-binding protein [Pusillimonas sp. ANT_WB101]